MNITPSNTEIAQVSVRKARKFNRRPVDLSAPIQCSGDVTDHLNLLNLMN
jgi:hypothetical protein